MPSSGASRCISAELVPLTAAPCRPAAPDRSKKIRGPAPLSLALAHCDVNDDIVTFTDWTETDFRTGEHSVVWVEREAGPVVLLLNIALSRRRCRHCCRRRRRRCARRRRAQRGSDHHVQAC